MESTSPLKVVAIIQARMGSSRLPQKILKQVMGRPLLSYLIERVRRAKALQEIVIATTIESADDSIEQFCQKEHVACFRGSEKDVLQRYFQAAKHYSADVVVRICGDCPLIDPAIIDVVVNQYVFFHPHFDYVSNTQVRSFPRGMDVEVFSMASLKAAAQEAYLAADKEHVTPFIYRHPERFRLKDVLQAADQSGMRLTVDTEEDFSLIALLLENLYPRCPSFTLEDVVDVLKKHPEWQKINAHIQQRKV